jgi:hypothetical protein
MASTKHTSNRNNRTQTTIITQRHIIPAYKIQQQDSQANRLKLDKRSRTAVITVPVQVPVIKV